MAKTKTNHIPEGWVETTLGELVTFQRGHDLPKSKMIKGPFPIMGSNGIIGFHNQFTTRAPGVTVGRSGNIGNAFLIKQDYWAHNTTLYAKQFHGSNPVYVYYLVKNLKFDRFNSGSAVPSLNRNFIHPIQLNAPPLREQEAIADTLSSLDDKIELLRKQNETLEAIAQTIFKEWFVNFNFPDKNGKPYKASGGKMINSELGEIPEGWRVGELNNFARHIKNSLSPSKQEDETFHHYSIPAFDQNKTPVIEKGKYIKSNKYCISDNSFLVSKLNPSTPRIWTIIKIEPNSICSTEFQNIIPDRNNCFAFVEALIKSNSFSEELASKAHGTSSSHQRVKPEDILNFECMLPEEKTISSFNKLGLPLIKQNVNNLSQIQTLACIRDTLLPKLMSGQVRVKGN